MPNYDTAGTIIADAAAELGVISFAQKNGLDPFGSPDPNLGQLCQLLKAAGRDLVRSRAWTHLQATYDFTTAAGQGAYALPADYWATIPETEWNRTNRLPLGGPLSPPEWAYLKGQLAGVVFSVLYKVEGGQLVVYPDTNTPGGFDIAFQYVSRNWVRPANAYAGSTPPAWAPNTTYTPVTLPGGYVVSNGNVYSLTGAGVSARIGSGPSGTGAAIADSSCQWAYLAPFTNDTPAAATDVILFDSHLVSRALKLFWRREKSLDTTTAQADFDDAFDQACIADKPGRALQLGRSTAGHPHFINSSNIPVTGAGGGT